MWGCKWGIQKHQTTGVGGCKVIIKKPSEGEWGHGVTGCSQLSIGIHDKRLDSYLVRLITSGEWPGRLYAAPGTSYSSASDPFRFNNLWPWSFILNMRLNWKERGGSVIILSPQNIMAVYVCGTNAMQKQGPNAQLRLNTHSGLLGARSRYLTAWSEGRAVTE